ncbi:hypothetical protein [Brumimicrobium mesophilum]|uniref:hypothetical protein n=1 Tax=Brumimicrobium mesophilum TaxID=392717 RepID=UPI000D144999|nr:hypothetical protein [Brumimicrobium mesophilum]
MRLILLYLVVLTSQFCLGQEFVWVYYGEDYYCDVCELNKISEIEINRINVDADSTDTLRTTKLKFNNLGYLVEKEITNKSYHLRTIRLYYDECNDIERIDTFSVTSEGSRDIYSVPSNREVIVSKKGGKVFKEVSISNVYDESINSIIKIEVEKRYFYKDDDMLYLVKKTVQENDKLVSETEVNYIYINSLIKKITKEEQGSVKKTEIHFNYILE